MNAPAPRAPRSSEDGGRTEPPAAAEDVFLTSDELARRWRRTVGTLANWRLEKRGPDYVMPAGKGGPVLYRLSDIERYERARTVKAAATLIKT